MTTQRPAERPWERPSDPAQGHWSTRGGATQGNDSRRGPDPRLQQRADERPASREAWERGERYAAPRYSYQWRDYDRYRAEHFRFDGGRYFGRSRYHLGSYAWPRGFSVRLWLVGEWLPSVFLRDERYMLEYWRYGLYPPPPGCRWVRVGDDALLVDNFSSEVLDVIYNLFW